MDGAATLARILIEHASNPAKALRTARKALPARFRSDGTHAADALPVRFQARSMGVYRVAVLSQQREGQWVKTRGYVWMARSGRWSRLMTDVNQDAPRARLEDAQADHARHRAAMRAIR